MINKARAWESQILRPHLQTSENAGRNLGGLQNQNIAVHEALMAEDGLASADRESCEQNLEDNDVDRV